MPLLRKEPEIHPETLFDLADAWHVAHVRSRQEKTLARYFLDRGVAFYLPQTTKLVVRAGRKRESHLVLFPGYVFFRGDGAARALAVRSGVTASVIDVEDQQTINDELRQIRALQVAGASFERVETFATGDAVRITEGPFAGYSGVVVHGRRGDRLLVSISTLRATIAVEFGREVLTRR